MYHYRKEKERREGRPKETEEERRIRKEKEKERRDNETEDERKIRSVHYPPNVVCATVTPVLFISELRLVSHFYTVWGGNL